MSQFSGNPNSLYGVTDPYANTNQIGQLIALLSANMGPGGSTGRLPINLFNPSPNAFIPQEIESRRLSQTVIESMTQNVELQRLKSSNYNQGLIALNTMIEQRPLTDAEKSGLLRQGDALGSLTSNPILQGVAAQMGLPINALDPFGGYAAANNTLSSLRMSGSSYNINAGLVGELTSGLGKRMYDSTGAMLDGNKSFGFDPQQQSQIIKNLQTRGAFAYNLDDVVGELSSAEKSAFKSGDSSVVGKRIGAKLNDQLDKVSPYLSEASALFNTKDVGDILSNLDAITGNGLAKMSPAQIRNQVSTLKDISETFGISVKAAQDFIGQTAALAESRGLSGSVAARGALSSLGTGMPIAGYAAEYFGASAAVNPDAAAAYRAGRVLSAQASPMAGRIANTTDFIERAAASAGISVQEFLSDKDKSLSTIYAARNGNITADVESSIKDPGALAGIISKATGASVSEVMLSMSNTENTQRNLSKLDGLSEGVANTNLKNKLMARAPATMRDLMKQYDTDAYGATTLLSSALGADDREHFLKAIQGNASTKDIDLELASRDFDSLKNKAVGTKAIDPVSAAAELAKQRITDQEDERRARGEAAQAIHDMQGESPLWNRITKTLIDSNGDLSALAGISSINRLDTLNNILKDPDNINKIAGSSKAKRTAELTIIGHTAGATDKELQKWIEDVNGAKNQDEAGDIIRAKISNLKGYAEYEKEYTDAENAGKVPGSGSGAQATEVGTGNASSGLDTNSLISALPENVEWFIYNNKQRYTEGSYKCWWGINKWLNYLDQMLDR